jgi:hypothetical protein
MQTLPGYVGHRLHRLLTDDTAHRFVNCATWETIDLWRTAHERNSAEEFRRVIERPEWVTFPATALGLYEVVDEATSTHGIDARHR